MAKGYWIGHADVQDVEIYKKYVAANAGPLAAYGAKFLVRGGDATGVEGALKSRHVVLEFSSYQQALDCYNSLPYQEAKDIRDAASRADMVVVEGYDGPQPGE